MQPRVLGIDDAPFVRDVDKSVPVIGVLYRGNQFLEGLLATKVRQDGWDATKKIAAAIKEGRFRSQIEAILMKGIAVAGMNVIDIQQLYHDTRKPVIVIMRKKPDPDNLRSAMKGLPNPAKRWALVERAGELHSIDRLVCQLAGLTPKEAQKLIRLTTARGNLPEALRVAHVVASGLTRGESKGRA